MDRPALYSGQLLDLPQCLRVTPCHLLEAHLQAQPGEERRRGAFARRLDDLDIRRYISQ
jgi:hypothetical protein